MHLTEVVARDNALGPYAWVDPWDITGVDAHQLKQLNKTRWFEGEQVSEPNIDTADLSVVEYLINCLRKMRDCRQCGDALPVGLDVTSDRQLNAAIFMIDTWGSNFAAVMFSATRWPELVTDLTAAKALEMLATKYLHAEPFVRDILRDFILELYHYGPLWDPPGGRFVSSLQDEQNEFLKRILNGGYITLKRTSGHPMPEQTKPEP